MAFGVIGKKIGMSRVFSENKSIPVTIIKLTPNWISQVKSLEKDSYRAVQVFVEEDRHHNVSKPLRNHLAKAGIDKAGKKLYEFHISSEEESEVGLGELLEVNFLKLGQKVDVTGNTKGRGFSGVIRRYHFRGGKASHGNSLSHRAPGSIGQCQTPGKVFKGKKMAGQMGNVRRTIQNLEIMRISQDNQLLLLRGAIPGSAGGEVLVKPAIKSNRG
ncbi:50S ribosomal protein L3 [Candidatus Nitrosacidococcus tergens]|uniref:Large ribosomal subunit protein uL3 n=1 Tax=Candidatus Nitrosacidococcus tergens TaxID=553981 RepID=A0A7G1Q7W2_9GAMM|nr:50S ribosomal protein L3 [Candidatus Nitrosacidococcus tergens]CAB1274807.1 50S ribosomal subunit protein L3 [Candidatus Nitrosacidococcus tergens]